jgi:hypothetical protein
VFFNVFEANGQEWLTTDLLLDQEEVEECSERKVRPPWSGYFFVNAGLDDNRSWEDNRKHGFIAAPVRRDRGEQGRMAGGAGQARHVVRDMDGTEEGDHRQVEHYADRFLEGCL